MRRPNPDRVIMHWRHRKSTAEIAEILDCRESDAANIVACYIDRKHHKRERAARLSVRRAAEKDRLGINVRVQGGISLPALSIERAG